MNNTARHAITRLAFTVTVFTAGQALAAEDGQTTMVIHVDNYARILRADRSAAENEVTRIYAKAGVRIVWATGNDKADGPGLHVRVQLLSTDMAMRKIRTERLDDTVLGRAARGAAYAYIVTHRIASLALRHGDDFRRLLGLVMAHEVGHLVLPIYSHSDSGIMRANIVVRSKSFQDFTPEQAVTIRSMLLAASRLHSAITDAAVGC